MRGVRALLWILAGGVALGAAGDDTLAPSRHVAARGEEATGPAPAQPERAPSPAQTVALLLDLDRLREAREAQGAATLFGPKSWYVAPPLPPPPPPAPPPVAPRPVAPPLPFVFIGRMIEGGKATVFLVSGDRVYVAAEGDVIGGSYRLEEIAPDRITLEYLPLKVKQTLAAEDPT